MAKTVSYMQDPYGDIASLVWSEYSVEGFPPAYNRGKKITAMEVGVKYKTPEGQVRWLERCVSPVVTQLCMMGMEEVVIDVLKLRSVINNKEQYNGSK